MFIPLIEEIDTIDPGRCCATKFGRHGLAHEERRLQVVGEDLAPVVAGHPGRRHPRRRRSAARDVDQTVQAAVGAPRMLDHRGDALVGRRVGRDGDHRQPLLSERNDMLVEVFLRAAHRDHGGSGPGGHRRNGGADAAAAGTGNHHDAPVESEEVLHRLLPSAAGNTSARHGMYRIFCPDKICVLPIGEHYSHRPTPLSRSTGMRWTAIVWTRWTLITSGPNRHFRPDGRISARPWPSRHSHRGMQS